MVSLKLVLTHQKCWIISRKELEAAKLLTEVMLQTSRALSTLNCTFHFCTDSQVVLKWIVNLDLSLARFVKRRVDRIHLVAPPSSWKYVNTLNNPADVGTRELGTKQSTSSLAVWLEGPPFLKSERVEVKPVEHSLVVHRTLCGVDSVLEQHDAALDKLIEVSPNLYTLKKRCAYLFAFVQFVIAKAKKVAVKKPVLDATYLDSAFIKVVEYVQSRCFGAVVDCLSNDTPDNFEHILKRLSAKAKDPESTRRFNELKTLRNLRPCVGSDRLLRVEGRLENADLPLDTIHPIILPGRHPLTALVVLAEHEVAGHGGPVYTLMKTRERFWIIHGTSSVKHYIATCGKCALRKAKPIRQLMADLPACRVSACNKPFKFTGLDYFGHYFFRQGRSECKAWGLLFTCLCTRCLHVELVTSLDLDNFLLAFTRFTNLRGAVDTIYSDNASTFRAAAENLPKLLGSTEFCNSLRKSNINWVFVPPYAPSQNRSSESMVKLFKIALSRVLEPVRRKPSLIELQTFFSDAVRIVNDRPLTTLSDQPNDLGPITPSSFLGQHLSPNTPVCTVHNNGDLRRDFVYNSTLAHRFWLTWMKAYLPSLQGRKKWRTLRNNLVPGQLVLVGGADDIAGRGSYRLGRIHRLHPQTRKGKEIVRRATIAVMGNNASGEIEYVLRDLAKIAPV